MKKTLISFIAGLMMMFSFASCETAVYATTQDDIYVEASTDVVQMTVDYNVVIRYGTPYYHNGALLYYLYDGLYYYPFYYNNYWYIRAYRRPFNHLDYYPYFRPHRYDYRFDRRYTPHHNWYRPSRPVTRLHTYNRPYTRPNGGRPDVMPHRPNNRNVTPTRPTTPNRGTINRNQGNPRSGNRSGNFGGRR